MRLRKLSPGKIVILLLAVVFLLGAGTLALVGKGHVPQPYACTTHTVKNIPDLAGAHFSITHTACQDYTHKKFVSVYVQRVVPPGAPFFKHWFNKPALIFRYHPESWTAPVPSLSRISGKTVRIAISRVSKIDDKRPNWLGLTFQFRIGHVDHPLLPSRR